MLPGSLYEPIQFKIETKKASLLSIGAFKEL